MFLTINWKRGMYFAVTTNGVWPSTHALSYLDRKLLRNVDLDSLELPTSHSLDYSDHRYVCVQMMLGARPGIAGHWKFNIYFLDSRYFG